MLGRVTEPEISQTSAHLSQTQFFLSTTSQVARSLFLGTVRNLLQNAKGSAMTIFTSNLAAAEETVLSW